MVILKRCLGLVLLASCLLCSFGAQAEDPQPLRDYLFSGYGQGRLVGFLNDELPSAPANSSQGLLGWQDESAIQVLLKHLEFKLSTALTSYHLTATVDAEIETTQAVMKEVYLTYAPTSTLAWSLGLFRVPFGLEPQTTSQNLDTVERALIYHLGNFDWKAPIGLSMVGERSWGLKLDMSWPETFASFSPLIQAAVVTGNGWGVLPDKPVQVLLRAGVNSHLELEDLRHELALGLSASYGWHHFQPLPATYLPIGSEDDLKSDPPAAIPSATLASQAATKVFGLDVNWRINDWVVKGEWVYRQIADFASEGYYLTGIWEMASYLSLPLDLVGRWEEANTGLADGVHAPQSKYQAITLGLNWRLGSLWRLQAHYLTLWLDLKPHLFPGSDLVIVQLQLNF